MSSTFSSLTTLASTPSSTSFYTARDGSPAAATEDTATSLSSPAEPDVARFRDARQLPRELKQHIQIFLEEQMYHGALHMLDILLGAGRSRRRGAPKPAFVPPPAQLALLGTLAVHPLHTTRAPETSQLQISSQALTYLRTVLATVGPVNANLRAAFDFAATSRNRRGGGGWDADMGVGGDGDSYDDDEAEADRINSRFAAEGSVWHRVQDFWAAAGWALNCAAAHPHRWAYWRPWLEFMCDALESDWEERARLDLEAHQRAGASPGTDAGGDRGGGSRECEHRLLRDSLLMAYVSHGGRSGGPKAILRALFADGSQSARQVFQEVFEREAKGASDAAARSKRKRQTLDLENDKFGDYYDDEDDALASSQGSEAGTPRRPPGSRGPAEEAAPVVSPGMIESIPIRMRLFSLLSKLSLTFPKAFATFGDLSEQFARSVKSLPLPLFSLFVSSNVPGIPPEALVCVLRDVIEFFLPRSSPSPGRIDPATDDTGGVSMPILEKCYLPFAANTISAEDNAKYSLVLEGMFSVLFMRTSPRYTDDLGGAVQHGIQAREDKTRKKKAVSKTDDAERTAREVLSRSGQRLLVLLNALAGDVIEVNGG